MPYSMPWPWITEQSNQLVAGLIGGTVGAGLSGFTRYVAGWHRAKRNRGEAFHIAATTYPRIDPGNIAHAPYLPALAAGKTHVQQMVWLGAEVDLKTFLANPYVCREVLRSMSRVCNAGLLIGEIAVAAERQLLKKLVGYHNSIPRNDNVLAFKAHVGCDAHGRVHGISPPTHEHYAGSPHRRVLRAMFIANSQLANGIPPIEQVHVARDSHANRHATVSFLIDAYRRAPERFEDCRVYF